MLKEVMYRHSLTFIEAGSTVRSRFWYVEGVCVWRSENHESSRAALHPTQVGLELQLAKQKSQSSYDIAQTAAQEYKTGASNGL